MMEVKKSFFVTFSHPFEIKKLEEVDCNLCGSKRFRRIGRELIFDIRECADCSLVYVNPQPAQEELPAFYAAMYPDRDDRTAQTRSLGAVEGHLCRLLMRLRPQGGRLLEVGCGYGSLLKRLADLPWSLTAIDPAMNAVEYVRHAVPRASVFQSGVEDAEFPAESQDCVIAVAVMEHVKDPRSVLQRMTRWLAPNGILLLQVPYLTPFLKLKKWAPWLPIYMEAPRHLFDFSPRTLRRYYDELGYREIGVEVARPYCSPTRLSAALIQGVKLPALMLHALSGGQYVYPYSCAFVMHGKKGPAAPE